VTKIRDLVVVRGMVTPVLLPDVRKAIGSHSTATDDGEWDAGANTKRLPNERGPLRAAHAWVDSDGDADAKSSYKFPHHFVDSSGKVGAASTRACSSIIAALNGGRGGADIPDADRQAVYNHAARHLRDADMEPPELNSQRPQQRDSEVESPVMTVRFSAFGEWYTVDSWFEGKFLERTAHGAFAKTIQERSSQVKVLFNHGMDFHIGDKVLGVPSLLEERNDSPYAEVPLLDTSYNRDLQPGLAAGAYGSSFMFNVLRETWNEEPGRSAHNPDGIPERTITEVRLLEFGPVTWPANPAATSGLRSGTDWYAERIRSRSPERYEALAERFTDFRAQHGLRTPDADAARTGTSADGAAIPTDAPDTAPAVHHSDGLSPSQRAARLRELRYPFLKEAS
jgi:HK97 family phage prohead protease